MGKGVPTMYDLNLLIQAGIDPKTGLPKKLGACSNSTKEEIKANLQIVDRQDAINCFTWTGLPDGITPEIIERILYYKGQGMFFYMEEVDKFYFLPYALDGTIDVYGRYNTVTPLSFNGVSSVNEDGKEKPWITGLKRDVEYEIQLPEDYISETGEILVNKILETQNEKCVILKDFTEGIPQTNPRRCDLQEPILDLMSDMLPFMRTALLNSTGVQGMRVSNTNEASEVLIASNNVNNAALNGQKWVPITTGIEIQELTSGATGKAEEFMLALQSLDNFRLSLYGLDNGGLFQKKSHMLQEEQEVNQGNVGLILRDRLNQRQTFCSLVNSIWGIGIWCEVSEPVIGMDINGDGVMGTNESEGTNTASSNTENKGGNEYND